ncbi:hypothetical protein [uncultured Nocardioides sp.]|uniref:hypothetical protein n=1 Tax=uncultured Nocardioides sp. TaxID=198441 RepID=UPI00262F4C09|nr:hypothetical protein [uncultured Nocardioides sp.]
MAPDDATDPNGPADPVVPAAPAAEREPEWKRRRRLAAVFGDGAPEQTSDDRDPREDRSGKGDDWYRDQVPPHHG